MTLQDLAPALSLLWPYLVTLLVGVSLPYVIKSLRPPGTDPGRPLDEDNYVFRDSEKEKDGKRDNSDDVEGEDESPGDPWNEHDHVPYTMTRYQEREMVQRSREMYELLNTRRTVRFFSPEHIPREVIENVIKAAGTSPSGAHTEPWTYVVVSDKEVKKQIREIIEDEEEINYRKRMGEKWLSDIAHLNTSWNKPFLEEAPYLVIVFKQMYGLTSSGQKKTHYYSEISTSLSVGLFLAALTNVGLVTVTSTPMNAGPRLRLLLNRPTNEKVLLLLPVGYPAKDCTVPNLQRKPLEDIYVHI